MSVLTDHHHRTQLLIAAMFHCRKVIFPSESQAPFYSRCPGLSRNKLPDPFHCSAAEPKERNKISIGTQFPASGTFPPQCPGIL